MFGRASACWRGALSNTSKGNLAKGDGSPYTTAEDLVTPTIKATTYTTGRGGTGNMARNDNPDNARLAQDVNAPVHSDPKGIVHYGRGGAANIISQEGGQERKSGDVKRKDTDETADKGLLAKGKDFLSKLGGKK